jgi:hypothetical protein
MDYIGWCSSSLLFPSVAISGTAIVDVYGTATLAGLGLLQQFGRLAKNFLGVRLLGDTQLQMEQTVS